MNAVVLYENEHYRVRKLTKYRNLISCYSSSLCRHKFLTYEITMSQSLASNLFLVRTRAHKRHAIAKVETIAERTHTTMTGTCNWISFMAAERWRIQSRASGSGPPLRAPHIIDISYEAPNTILRLTHGR